MNENKTQKQDRVNEDISARNNESTTPKVNTGGSKGIQNTTKTNQSNNTNSLGSNGHRVSNEVTPSSNKTNSNSSESNFYDEGLSDESSKKGYRLNENSSGGSGNRTDLGVADQLFEMKNDLSKGVNKGLDKMAEGARSMSQNSEDSENQPNAPESDNRKKTTGLPSSDGDQTALGVADQLFNMKDDLKNKTNQGKDIAKKAGSKSDKSSKPESSGGGFGGKPSGGSSIDGSSFKPPSKISSGGSGPTSAGGDIASDAVGKAVEQGVEAAARAAAAAATGGTSEAAAQAAKVAAKAAGEAAKKASSNEEESGSGCCGKALALILFFISLPILLIMALIFSMFFILFKVLGFDGGKAHGPTAQNSMIFKHAQAEAGLSVDSVVDVDHKQVYRATVNRDKHSSDDETFLMLDSEEFTNDEKNTVLQLYSEPSKSGKRIMTVEHGDQLEAFGDVTEVGDYIRVVKEMSKDSEYVLSGDLTVSDKKGKDMSDTDIEEIGDANSKVDNVYVYLYIPSKHALKEDLFDPNNEYTPDDEYRIIGTSIKYSLSEKYSEAREQITANINKHMNSNSYNKFRIDEQNATKELIYVKNGDDNEFDPTDPEFNSDKSMQAVNDNAKSGSVETDEAADIIATYSVSRREMPPEDKGFFGDLDEEFFKVLAGQYNPSQGTLRSEKKEREVLTSEIVEKEGYIEKYVQGNMFALDKLLEDEEYTDEEKEEFKEKANYNYQRNASYDKDVIYDYDDLPAETYGFTKAYREGTGEFVLIEGLNISREILIKELGTYKMLTKPELETYSFDEYYLDGINIPAFDMADLKERLFKKTPYKYKDENGNTINDLETTLKQDYYPMEWMYVYQSPSSEEEEQEIIKRLGLNVDSCPAYGTDITSICGYEPQKDKIFFFITVGYKQELRESDEPEYRKQGSIGEADYQDTEYTTIEDDFNPGSGEAPGSGSDNDIEIHNIEDNEDIDDGNSGDDLESLPPREDMEEVKIPFSVEEKIRYVKANMIDLIKDDIFTGGGGGRGSQSIITVARGELGVTKGMEYQIWYYGGNIPGGWVNWCAVFVSWAAEQIGLIDAGIFPKSARVSEYVDWYSNPNNPGSYHPKGSYIPVPGDLVIYSFGGSRPDHIGIVTGVDGNSFSSVEGNTAGNGVGSPPGIVHEHASIPLNHAQVLGFASPDYPEEDGLVQTAVSVIKKSVDDKSVVKNEGFGVLEWRGSAIKPLDEKMKEMDSVGFAEARDGLNAVEKSSVDKALSSQTKDGRGISTGTRTILNKTWDSPSGQRVQNEEARKVIEQELSAVRGLPQAEKLSGKALVYLTEIAVEFRAGGFSVVNNQAFIKIVKDVANMGGSLDDAHALAKGASFPNKANHYTSARQSSYNRINTLKDHEFEMDPPGEATSGKYLNGDNVDATLCKLTDRATTMKTFMDYGAITNKKSQQWHLQNTIVSGIKTETNQKSGVRQYGNRYTVAMASTYGGIGTRHDITIGGKTIKVIIGDTKAGTDCQHPDGSFIEFIVERSKIPGSVNNSGTFNSYEEFSGVITRVVPRGKVPVPSNW